MFGDAHSTTSRLSLLSFLGFHTMVCWDSGLSPNRLFAWEGYPFSSITSSLAFTKCSKPRLLCNRKAGHRLKLKLSLSSLCAPGPGGAGRAGCRDALTNRAVVQSMQGEAQGSPVPKTVNPGSGPLRVGRLLVLTQLCRQTKGMAGDGCKAKDICFPVDRGKARFLFLLSSALPWKILELHQRNALSLGFQILSPIPQMLRRASLQTSVSCSSHTFTKQKRSFLKARRGINMQRSETDNLRALRYRRCKTM